MRKKCREKRIDVNENGGSGGCREEGAGVQADDLEDEDRCEQQQSREFTLAQPKGDTAIECPTANNDKPNHETQERQCHWREVCQADLDGGRIPAPKKREEQTEGNNFPVWLLADNAWC